MAVEPPDQRRAFLKLMTAGLGALTAALAIIPGFGFLCGPLGRRTGVRDHSPRVWVLALVVLCFMGALLGRLGQVQIVGHDDYRAAAATVNTRTVTEPAVRGRILDRTGTALVDNTTQTVVTVDRAVLVDSADGGRDLVTRVAKVVGVPFEQLWGRTQLCGVAGAPPAPLCWAGSAYVPIPLVSGVDPRKALSLLERPDRPTRSRSPIAPFERVTSSASERPR